MTSGIIGQMPLPPLPENELANAAKRPTSWVAGGLEGGSVAAANSGHWGMCLVGTCIALAISRTVVRSGRRLRQAWFTYRTRNTS
jgi:hypothetical protein